MNIDALFPDLFSKTFFMLGCQLFVTWISAYLTIQKFRQLYSQHVSWITATKNESGEDDLQIDFDRLKIPFYALLIVNTLIFLVLLFWGERQELPISFSIFTVWSILTGIEMALCLLSVDENLGARVLGITASVVFGTSLAGLYANIDFGFLGPWLFGALLLLLVANIFNLFRQISTAKQRFMAGVGVAIFTLYLLYDFNRVEKAKSVGLNSWETATKLTVSIYLDIINLFLQLLKLMSKHHH